MSEGELDLAEWNSNKASLIRVDKLMQVCHFTFFEEDYLSYFKNLRNLYGEVHYKMKHLQHKLDKETKKEILCDRCQSEKLFLDLTAEYKKVRIHNNEKFIELFMIKEHSFFLFLTDFMGKKGMLIADAVNKQGL